MPSLAELGEVSKGAGLKKIQYAASRAVGRTGKGTRQGEFESTKRYKARIAPIIDQRVKDETAAAAKRKIAREAAGPVPTPAYRQPGTMAWASSHNVYGRPVR